MRLPGRGCTRRANRTRSIAGWTPTKRTAWPGWSSNRVATAAFPPPQGAELRELVRQPPALAGLAQSRWRLADLRQTLPWLGHYSLAGVSRVLTRLRIRRRRGRFSLHSPDRTYRTKLAWIAQAHAAATAHSTVRLLYADEFSLYRQPTLAPVYTPAGTEPRAALSLQSNTCQRLSAALDVTSGRVVWTAGRRMDVPNLCRFLRSVRTAYPTETLVLVWDNWPVHQHPTVLAQAAALDIELLWLPTDAPWTNPIEKLWRWLKQTLLHHHRLADRWADLRAAVAAFLDQFTHGSGALLRYVGLLPD
jgi:transposase